MPLLDPAFSLPAGGIGLRIIPEDWKEDRMAMAACLPGGYRG